MRTIGKSVGEVASNAYPNLRIALYQIESPAAALCRVLGNQRQSTIRQNRGEHRPNRLENRPTHRHTLQRARSRSSDSESHQSLFHPANTGRILVFWLLLLTQE